MSQECVEQFIGRLITDDLFRRTVQHRFHCACREHGIVLTAHEEAVLRRLNYGLFEDIALRIDGEIRRECRRSVLT